MPCPAPRTTLLLSRLNSITPSVYELTKTRASASAATSPGPVPNPAKLATSARASGSTTDSRPSPEK